MPTGSSRGSNSVRASGVGPDQEDRAGERRQRQQRAVPGADEQPHGVRQDQPDEPDRAAHRDERAGEQRGPAEQQRAAARRRARRARPPRCRRTRTRRACGRSRAAGCRRRRCAPPAIATDGPVGAGERAEQPVEDLAVAVARRAPEDDEARDRAEHRRHREAREHRARRRERARRRSASARVATSASSAPGERRERQHAGRRRARARPPRPTEAPDESPSRYGSASGLRVSACMTAPQSARPAPTAAAVSTRGIRSSHTMPSRSGRQRRLADAEVREHARPHVGRAESGRPDGDGDDDGCREQHGEADRPRSRAQPGRGRGEAEGRAGRQAARPGSVRGSVAGTRTSSAARPLGGRVISSPSSPSCSTSDATAPTLRTPASVAGNARPCSAAACTAGSAAVAGFASSCAIFDSAVFHGGVDEHDHVGVGVDDRLPADATSRCRRTSAAMFSRPAASMIICGAPMPAPTNGVSSPERVPERGEPVVVRLDRVERGALLGDEVGRGIRDAEDRAGLLDLAEDLVERERVGHVALALARGRGDVGGDAERVERRRGRRRPRPRGSTPSRRRRGRARPRA